MIEANAFEKEEEKSLVKKDFFLVFASGQCKVHLHSGISGSAGDEKRDEKNFSRPSPDAMDFKRKSEDTN